jgi:hypothetical protein
MGADIAVLRADMRFLVELALYQPVWCHASATIIIQVCGCPFVGNERNTYSASISHYG